MPYSDVMYFEGWMVGGGGGVQKSFGHLSFKFKAIYHLSVSWL